MRKFLIAIAVLIIGVALLFIYNQYDAQSRGDAIACRGRASGRPVYTFS